MGRQKIDDDLTTGRDTVYNQDKSCFSVMMQENPLQTRCNQGIKLNKIIIYMTEWKYINILSAAILGLQDDRFHLLPCTFLYFLQIFKVNIALSENRHYLIIKIRIK